jgi:hypothetical protein
MHVVRPSNEGLTKIKGHGPICFEKFDTKGPTLLETRGEIMTRAISRYYVHFVTLLKALAVAHNAL